mmetsp:Transcript_23861/g.54304  ORF Transcript_23861/g.54304 Transcript_23861/m.54304 type:complete len:225 (+) Transcript_23861:1043-1717(+)
MPPALAGLQPPGPECRLGRPPQLGHCNQASSAAPRDARRRQHLLLEHFTTQLGGRHLIAQQLQALARLHPLLLELFCQSCSPGFAHLLLRRQQSSGLMQVVLHSAAPSTSNLTTLNPLPEVGLNLLRTQLRLVYGCCMLLLQLCNTHAEPVLEVLLPQSRLRDLQLLTVLGIRRRPSQLRLGLPQLLQLSFVALGRLPRTCCVPRQPLLRVSLLIAKDTQLMLR